MNTALTKTFTLLAEHLDESIGNGRKLRLPFILLGLIAATLLALFVWMALAHVDRVVHTQGRVIPSGKGQLVQHLEGGIVSKVFVKEGDEVTAGQQLMAISALQANSQRGEKNARLAGLRARVARLQAEADGADSFVVPSDLDPRSPEALAEAAAFQARRATLAQTTSVNDEQVRQKRQEMIELETRQRGLAAELETARQQQALVAQMLSRNAASQMEILDARGRVERLLTQLREAEISVPRLQAAAQELSARRAETVARFRSESRTSLAESRVDLARLTQEIRADNDRVDRTLVTAPTTGRVNKLLVNTVGGVVKPGDTLLELTPSDESLVIEARVLPQDRGELREGQRSVVRIGAYDYTIYGVLDGRIEEISADSITDERGDRYFRVRLAVPPASSKAFGQVITPGMTVTADAITGDRTVLQYLLSPIRGLAASAFRDRT